MANFPLSNLLDGTKKLWSVVTGAAADDAAASGNPMLVAGKYSATPATRHDGDVVTQQMTADGAALVQLSGSIPEGTNKIGKVGIDQTTPGTTNGVAITSSIESVAATPVVGVKTVTATAAEIFAGASIKASRRKLIIRNEDPVLRMRIGPSSVTQQNGLPIEPGATAIIKFDPATAVSVYGISEGAALNIAVWEV